MGLMAERDDAMPFPVIFALLPVLLSFGWGSDRRGTKYKMAASNLE